MQTYIEQQLQRLNWDIAPQQLYHPIGYALESGGKRIRPQLVLMGCELFGGTREAALPAALAIEVFHNFTLLHDDIMDNADMRRGRPTVHRKWDDNTAILSGDAMMIKAYEFLEQLPDEQFVKIVPLFTKTALQVCEGQQLDIDMERCEAATLSEYFEMIRLKTAVLLAAALKMGAIVAGADATDAQLLYDFGIDIGIAFQLRDDYLDTFGNAATFGKRIGGDILCGKKTFLLITALDRADDTQRQIIKQAIADKQLDDAQKIAIVTKFYQQFEADKACEDAMNERYQQALTHLQRISGHKNDKEPFVALAAQLMGRNT
ncbi:MAG: polyprenyl synthetase family protein [Paludibacteraceae bacterium]